MPTVEQIREAGFTDEEIQTFLDEQNNPLVKAGFSPDEIKEHYGVMPSMEQIVKPIPEIRKPPERTLIEKITGRVRDLKEMPETIFDIFRDNPQKQARATNAITLSETLNIPINRAYEDQERIHRQLNERNVSIEDFKSYSLPKLDYFDKLKDIQKRPEQLVPYVAGGSEALRFGKLFTAVNRLEENRGMTKQEQEDLKLLREFVDQSQKDTTFGYKVLSVVSAMPAFMGELLSTWGVYTGIKKGTLEAAKKGLTRLLRKEGQAILEKKLVSAGLKGTAIIAGRTAQALVAGSTRIVSGTIQRMVDDFQLTGAEKGELQGIITGEGEDLGIALTKAFGEQWVETLSEFTGGALTAVAKPVKNALIKRGILKSFMKLNPTAKIGDVRKVFEKMGYHGVIGEMFEERVGEVGHGLLESIGLGDQKYKLPSLEQLAVELVSFSVPGVTRFALGEATKLGEAGGIETGKPKFDREEIRKKIIENKLAGRDAFEGVSQEEIDFIQKEALKERAVEPVSKERVKELEDKKINAIDANEATELVIEGKNIESHLEEGMRTGKDVDIITNDLRELMVSKLAEDKTLRTSEKTNIENKLVKQIADAYEKFLVGEQKPEIKPVETKPIKGKIESDVDRIITSAQKEVDEILKPYKGLGKDMDEIISAAKVAYKAGDKAGIARERVRLIKTLTEAQEKAKVVVFREKAITKEKISELKRTGELDKLKQRIKDRITFIDRGVKEGTIKTKEQIKGIQTELTAVLDWSEPELEAKDKAKFISKIKNIQTRAQLEKAMPEIHDRITRLVEASEIRETRKQIKDTLKKTKPKTQTGKPKGKFTADIQKILDLFRSASNMTQEQAQLKIDENMSFWSDYRKLAPPIDIALENKILSMVTGLDKRSSKEYQKLADEISEFVETGTIIAELKRFNIESERIEKQEYIVETVTGKKGIKIGRQTEGAEIKRGLEKFKQTLKSLGKKYVFGYNDLMGLLSWQTPQRKASLKKMFSVHKETQIYKQLQADYINEFNESISNSYGIDNTPLSINKKIQDNNLIIEVGTFTNSLGQKVAIKRTRDELIKRYIEFQDITLDESFMQGNNYTPEIIEAIKGKLTSQDKAFAQAQMEMYRKQYDKVNEVYRIINGIDLPFNEFYSPIKREGFEIDITKGFGEFIEEATYRRAVTNKSFIERVKSLLPIKYQGSVAVLDRHMTDTNYYIAWVEKVRELDAIFKDNDVRESINQEFGGSLLREIERHIDDFATNGKNRDTDNVVDWFRKNFTLGALMIKPALTIKQLVSTFAYLEVLTPTQFIDGIHDFLKNPVNNFNILKEESIFIRTRGAHMERDIKAAIKTEAYTRYGLKNTLSNYAMMNVKLGDQGAIALGTWAMRKAGFNVEEYEKFSSLTQQSADSENLSNVQKGGSFAKLFTMFMSSQRQYLAKEVNAIHSMFQEGGTSPENIKKVAKTLVIYHIILPVTFQFVANFGGTDDDDIKEYIRAGILGSLNGLFIFGEIINGVIRAALGLRDWKPTIPILNVADDIRKAVKKIKVEDITDKEVMEAVMQLTEAGNSLGIPVEQAVNMTKGVGDLIEGNTKEGVGLILGWSEYVLKGSKPKRKKITISP